MMTRSAGLSYSVTRSAANTTLCTYLQRLSDSQSLTRSTGRRLVTRNMQVSNRSAVSRSATLASLYRSAGSMTSLMTRSS